MTAPTGKPTPNPPNFSGPRRNIRKRATAKDNSGNQAQGPSTQSMLRLYSDDSPGLKVDPVVVLVLSLVLIASVFALHIYGKLTKAFKA
ncbi:Pre protein translocase Sec Sec61-beta subunit, partial [Conidiobolus coronatus NRRL 28638]